jgi:glutamine amidotransferase
VIVDYCKGNLRSVQKGFELAGARVRISADPCDITGADAVVLPGVGSFADAAATMRATGQMAAIKGAIGQGKPFLGICLGLQLMMEWGDEGAHEGGIVEGLGIIKGGCRRVDSHMANGALVKVPHVGWNQVAYCATTPSGQDALQSLFGGIDDGSNFYFTHSYQAEPNDSADIIAVVTHATEFASALACGMAFGVQFHPEKSSLKGLRVLENFVSLVVQHKASLNASLSSGLEMSHACI